MKPEDYVVQLTNRGMSAKRRMVGASILVALGIACATAGYFLNLTADHTADQLTANDLGDLSAGCFGMFLVFEGFAVFQFARRKQGDTTLTVTNAAITLRTGRGVRQVWMDPATKVSAAYGGPYSGGQPGWAVSFNDSQGRHFLITIGAAYGRTFNQDQVRQAVWPVIRHHHMQIDQETQEFFDGRLSATFHLASSNSLTKHIV